MQEDKMMSLAIRISLVLLFMVSPLCMAGEDKTISIGREFHDRTGFGDHGYKNPNPVFGRDIPLYKEYENAAKTRLQAPIGGDMILEQAIAERRSIRSFGDQALTLEQISRILQSANGITHSLGSYNMRSAPSGGALYPVDLYLFAFDVVDLAPGLYHYQVSDSSLELVKKGDFKDQLHTAANEQDVADQGRISIVMTARFDRSTRKYADRGYRYTYMESGAICQNIYLQVTALGLGTTAVGAFNDDALNRLIGIDGVDEAALLIMPIGYPK